MKSHFGNKDGFFSFLGILLALVLVVFLFNLAAKVYMKPAPIQDQAARNFVTQAGIDTTNYHSVLDSTVKQIREIEKQQVDRPNQIMQEMQDIQKGNE
jgi:hypothetical protein